MNLRDYYRVILNHAKPGYQFKAEEVLMFAGINYQVVWAYPDMITTNHRPFYDTKRLYWIGPMLERDYWKMSGSELQ